MPKLLFLVTEDWYFVSHRLELGRRASQMGYDVVVATRCAEHAHLIEQAGIRVVPLELSRRGTRPWTIMREIMRVRALYRRERPDVVHHVALKPVVIGGLAARSLGMRRVISAIAGMGFLFTDQDRANRTRRILQYVLPVAIGHGLAIVQNSDDFSIVQDTGIHKDRIRLIAGAGVDIDRFAPSAEPEGIPVVMLPSRMLWDKGVGEFIEATRSLKQQGTQARFVLVGDPDTDNPASVTETDLKSWVTDGLVEWWGHSEDMSSTLAKSAVVCLPSYREGMPKVLLEAMACGKPCITTDAPGCRDAVQDGYNGLVVPVKDAESLARAIKHLLDQPLERSRMGVNARERAQSTFSQNTINNATLELYKEVLA